MADSEPPAADKAVEQDAEGATENKGVKLHVKNIDESLTSESLQALFAPFGTVKKGEVKVTKEGTSKGFGQVIMSTQEEADKAIAALNDSKQGEKNMTVAIATSAEKKTDKGDGKGKAKGEKGKGKAKGEKGKGKGKAQANQGMQPPWMNPMMPQVPPWMEQNFAMMDPVQAQMWQQHMYTMQLYSMGMQQQMAAMGGMTPQASTGNTGAKGKGKGKGPKDKGTKVDGTFTGKLKSINFREDKGYGFIDCDETKATYGRDVYVSSDLVPKGAKVGDQFEFQVTLDQRGQLRATNVNSKS